jgi:glycosyltransferase involved in cell wall biosynthesis
VKPVRLAYVATHPIQYQAPLLRYINAHSNIEITALFMSDFSVREYHDEEFGTTFKWDVDLLSGYEHRFLPTFGDNTRIDGARPFVKSWRKALKETGADVCWSHGYAQPNNLRALFAARSLGMKTMTRSDIWELSKLGGGLKRRVKDKLVRWVFSRIDAFLCVGSLNRDYYRDAGVPDEKLFWAPYTVDNEAFVASVEAARPQVAAFKSSVDMDANRPVILYASKLTRRKKIDDLMAAYEKVAAPLPEHERPYLLVVGDGEMKPELESWMRRLGWESIKFLGFQNQSRLPLMFAASDIFVLPSAREPWGLIVNEVMNAGLPVVLTDECGCAPDLVPDGENGFVYPVGDIDALAQALATLSSDRELRLRMGEASRRIIETWSHRECLDALAKCLRGWGHEIEIQAEATEERHHA